MKASRQHSVSNVKAICKTRGISNFLQNYLGQGSDRINWGK